MVVSRLLGAYSPSVDTSCVALVKGVKVVKVVSKTNSQLGLHIADTSRYHCVASERSTFTHQRTDRLAHRATYIGEEHVPIDNSS